MNKYSSYKDSGVEWIGEIPEHWIIGKWRFYFKSGMGQTILKEQLLDNGNTPIFSATEEDVNFGYVDNPKLLLEKGDIVIPARGNSIGHVKLVKVPSTTTQTTIYSKKKSDKINSNYIYYYCKGNKTNLFPFVQTAIPQITVDEINSNHVVLPTLTEQQQIVAFLDDKTTKIDNLIEQKQNKIELLKEKRTALINHVVTKGLNPHVELKDSGVEWIGEIPKDWEVKSLKYLFNLGTGLSITKANLRSEGVPCVSYGEIHSRFGFEVDSSIHKLKCVDEDYLNSSNKALLKQGDFIFADTSEDIEGAGNFTYNKGGDEVFAGYHTVVAKPKNNFESRFFAFLFDSISFRTQIRRQVKGIKVFSITQSILKNIDVWIPAITEQQQIVNYLDEQTKEIDDLIQLEEQKIDLLKEYRQSLISEVVTGKVKVCEEDKSKSRVL